MRTVVMSAVVAVLAVASGATAQTLPLTETEALARLSPASARVRAIRSEVDVARAAVLAAGRWPNPRLTFDRESAAGISEDLFMVAVPLPITGRRGFDAQAASALVDATSSRADEGLRRLRADVRVAFGRLAAAQERERELTAAHQRARELADVLVKREAAGDAAGFDRLRAEREALDIEVDRATAAADRARAQAALGSFFGEPVEPSRLVAVTGRSSPPVLPTVDALVERAKTSRGELLAMGKEIDAAHLAARSADRRRLPEPEVVAGTKSSSAGGGDIGSVFTVQASLPLFDRGAPERALAQARASQTDARRQTWLIALRQEIAALRAEIEARRGIAEQYRSASLTTALQIERIAQVSYDAGERGILELLDAYRTGSAARIRQVTLDLAVRQAEIELEFVSGWEMAS